MMLDAARIAAILTDRYGLSMRGEALPADDGLRARFSPMDVAQTQGFAIGLLVGWRSVEAEFLPGNFAVTLVAEMEKASAQQRSAFAAFAAVCRREGAALIFAVNGKPLDSVGGTVWPASWRSVSIRLARSPLVIDHNDDSAVETLAIAWGGRMLGLSLSLLPLEHDVAGEEEGGVVRIEVNRYERSCINRAACIEVNGAICKVCGFDFGVVYGGIGAGFIEVHHLEPVSGLVPGTVVDPARDLVPLCANCHAIIHRRTPPLTVEELRAVIAAACAAGERS
jgi:5-methylcytosine-specific restriction protein A